MTQSDFLVLFPEFSPVAEQQPGLIPATIAQVELRVSDSWEDEREEIIGLETADAIARGPMGRAAQLIAKDGTTTYSRILDQRKIINGCVHPCRVV
jgi:hypothetical protein